MLVVNANEIATVDDVYDAVSENLLSWDPDNMLESDIRVLAEKFLILLHGGKQLQKNVKQVGARKLDNTVDISSTKNTLGNIDSIWNIKAQDVPAMVWVFCDVKCFKCKRF